MKSYRKFGSTMTVVDGIKFRSKAEAHRYGELKMLVKAGKIEGLELQPRFALTTQLTTGTFRGAGKALAGKYPVIGHYVADFKYFRLESPTGWIVEDVKGWDTPLSKWKRRHTEAQYGITVVIVR